MGRITNEGVVNVGGGVEVLMEAWSPDLAMAYDLITYRARICLYGIPLQNWNSIDFRTIVSGLGYPIH